MFRHVVLGLLQDGEPRHGYALMKRYRDRVGARVSSGNFYRELQRLVEEGLARTVDRRVDTDPRQAPYVITDAGRQAFARWFTDVTEAADQNAYEDSVTERLAFLADVSAGDVSAMLDRLQDELWTRAKALERARDGALAIPDVETRGLPVFGLITARRIRHVAAEVAFLTELRAAYEAWSAQHQPAPAANPASRPRPAARGRAESKRQRG
jgi:DNA-binding PadR family transcriptional regulator